MPLRQLTMEANIHWTKISRQFSERVFVVAEIELWSNALTLHRAVWEGVALHFHNGWQASDDQQPAQDATQWFASQSTTWSIRPDDALERWGGWARRTSSICWAHCDHEMQFCASSLKASLKYLDVSCPYNDAPKLSIMAVVAYGLTQQCFSYSVWLRETADSSHRVSLRSQLQNASGLRMIINILCSSLMRPAQYPFRNVCVSL